MTMDAFIHRVLVFGYPMKRWKEGVREIAQGTAASTALIVNAKTGEVHLLVVRSSSFGRGHAREGRVTVMPEVVVQGTRRTAATPVRVVVAAGGRMPQRQVAGDPGASPTLR